jgi:sialidase-1
MSKDTERPGGMTLPFEPGLTVGEETVSRTFQPSYVITRTGALLVFCQGRVREGWDNDPKVILVNRSRDGGRTWDGARALCPPMAHFAVSAYVTPTEGGERLSVLTGVCLKRTKDYYGDDPARLRERTGIDLDVVGAQNASALYRLHSEDDGEHWSVDCLAPERTPLYRPCNGFTPVFFNPIGQAHRIPAGPWEGRLILAAPVWAAPPGEEPADDFRSHSVTAVGSTVLYSDDEGQSWRMDGMLPDRLGGEASAVSVEEGRTLLMIRRLARDDMLEQASADVRPGPGQRLAHTSEDCGKSWSEPFLLPLSEVRCHGTLARAGAELLFSIPRGPEPEAESPHGQRCNGAIYVSADEGRTWRCRVVEEGSFSYSTVGPLDADRAITFFARGTLGEAGLGCRVVELDWLRDGPPAAGS